MSKNTVSSAAEVAVAEPESTQKTKTGKKDIELTGTPWDTFVKAGFGVKRLATEVLPGAPVEHSCKTTIIPSAANIVEHINAGHMDGFKFTIRENVTPWKGWTELAKAGVEIRWIRDEVTDQSIPITVQSLQAAMRPHAGKHRGAYQAYHNQLTLSLYIPREQPNPVGENLDEDDDYFE